MYQESYVRIPRPVLRSKSLTPAAKLVFGALHAYAWGEKEEAWPSVKRLAEDTGLSVRAVQYAIKNLEEHGLVEVIYRKDADNPKRNLSNIYVLTYVGADDVVQKLQEEPRRICTTTPANLAREPRKPSLEKSNKPSGYVYGSAVRTDEERIQEVRRAILQREREDHPDDFSYAELQ